eukprot:g48015.t1
MDATLFFGITFPEKGVVATFLSELSFPCWLGFTQDGHIKVEFLGNKGSAAFQSATGRTVHEGPDVPGPKLHPAYCLRWSADKQFSIGQHFPLGQCVVQENTDNFQYLESVRLTKAIDEDSQQRLQCASAAVGRLRKRMFEDSNVRFNAKI